MGVHLQHKSRRDGGLNVRGTWYELDESGCIDVSEEHAAVVLQGSMWARIGAGTRVVVKTVPAPVPAAMPKKEAGHPRAQDMSRAELIDEAKRIGLDVDGRWGKLKLVSLIREARRESDSDA